MNPTIDDLKRKVTGGYVGHGKDPLYRRPVPNRPSEWPEINAAYRKESDTSREAARSLTHKHLTKKRKRALDAIEEAGWLGLTPRELAEQFDGMTTEWQPTMIDLETMALAVRLRRTRRNSTGKRAHIYVTQGHMLVTDVPAPSAALDPKLCPHCGGEL